MKKIGILILITSICFCLYGCNFTTKEPISKTGFYFDTAIQITIYDSTNTKLLDQCFSYCEEFEQLVSRTIETSEIAQINQSHCAPVVVSDTTLELIQKGIYYGELTDGAFDITVAPLSSLWDFKNNPGNLPSDNAISEALSHVNYKNIAIEGNTVALTDPKTAIDLGGIAKGYIADYLKEYLKSEGVESALINLGGNVVTIGAKPNGEAFHIGIRKPFDDQGTAITSVVANDQSVVTSGSYERYFKVDGSDKVYHHILDIKTGWPCENELLSVTILSENSVDGDALSTACFALGLEDGMDLIESIDGIDAIFVTEDYKLYDTRT